MTMQSLITPANALLSASFDGAGQPRQYRRSVSKLWVMRIALVALVAVAAVAGGCAQGPTILAVEDQVKIDRSIIEYPSGFELRPYMVNLTAPAGICFAPDGTLFVAEGATRDSSPHIIAVKANGEQTTIYPMGRPLPFLKTGFRLYGPIGGICWHNGKLYVSHRDENDAGVVTALGMDGSHETIVGNLPAEGDYSVTDIAYNPSNDRIYFGMGAATNSGVVGLDDWLIGWPHNHRDFCDAAASEYKLNGYRFDTPNPQAGFFGEGDVAVTPPFQPFGIRNLRSRTVATDRPTSAIYSVNPTGGSLRVEATGIRLPRGLAFNDFFNLYATNNGMELRGTRPVKDDPDALVRVLSGTWYGWPDYTTTLEPVTEPPFQPDPAMRTTYPDLSFLIDHDASNLLKPTRETLLRGAFAPLSGAAKMTFAPGEGPFKEYHGQAIVALFGDRAPFATSNHPLIATPGYKIVRVDVEKKTVQPFIHNTENLPASRIKDHPEWAMERPMDVKFNPTNRELYIVDFGQMKMKSGREQARKGDGRIYRLVPIDEPVTATTRPVPKAPAQDW